MRTCNYAEASLKRATMLLLVMAGFILVPESVSAQPTTTTTTQQATEEHEDVSAWPVGATFVLAEVIGGGTFTEDPYVRRSAVVSLFRFSPYWDIIEHLRLTGTIDVLSSLVENYESVVTYRNRTTLSDTTLDISHLKLYTVPFVDIDLNAGLSLVFPTSLQSQYRSLIMNTTGHFGMVKKLGPVTLGYAFAGYKNFNRYTSPTVDSSEVGDHVVLGRFGGEEQLSGDLISTGGNNVEWGVLNTLSVGISPIDDLTLTILGEVNNAWTYDVSPKDEFSSPYAKGGRGQRDTWHGVLDVTYMMSKNWAVSVGTDTLVAPKTADNSEWVFPFANFSNNYRNNSSVYAALTASY